MERIDIGFIGLEGIKGQENVAGRAPSPGNKVADRVAQGKGNVEISSTFLI
tara:strand:+ start:312 stop:464 length:153 start_codon:yes stop_codon:yes gene_type:complete